MTVYWPNGSLTRPRVTSDFDPARKNPVTGIVQSHNGIDLVGWVDNCSPVDGTVVFAGYNGGAGNEVRIRADGPTAFHVGDYYRILHHAALYVRTGDRVKARQPVGQMGTTGQSTGVHCHFETHEWRLWNPVNPTDYMARANAGGSAAGVDSKPWEEDDMFTDQDRARLDATYAALFGPANLPAPKMTWAKPFGEEPGGAYYGVLDVVIYSQALIGKLSGQLAGVTAAIEQLARSGGGAVDMAAIEAAAEKGAKDALGDLVLVAGDVPDDAPGVLKA